MVKNDKRHTISKASEITGFSKHVLRFYEKEFDIEVPRNKSNHRYYTYKEIEKFLYIKALKERGLSNQQIKTIIESPEELIGDEELAATSEQLVISNDSLPTYNLDNVSEQIESLKEILGEEISGNIKMLRQGLTEDIDELLSKYIKEDNLNTDKDTLISENARLRMKLKERAYETAILKEKIKKFENKKSLLGKIFSLK